MPQIQEYLPQTSAQEPVGGVSPNLEAAGAVGRGIEKMGQDISDAGQFIHRRTTQRETADVYAGMADNRANQMDKLNGQIQDGSLDIDKFMDEYDDSTQDMSQNIETAEGRNYFERQNARLRGQLLSKANIGMSQIAARETSAKWNQAQNSFAASVHADPTTFEDTMGAATETIDQFIQNDGLPEKLRGHSLQELGKNLSKAAIRGWADIDTDKAREQLADPKYSDYISDDERKSLEHEIDAKDTANEVEGRRTDRAIKDAQKAAAEAYGAKALPQLMTGSLSPKDVMAQVQNGTLKWEEGQRWIKAIDARAKEKAGKSDPRLFISLANRITGNSTEPPIEDQQELLRYVGNGLNTEGLNRLSGLIDKAHPEIRQGDRQVLKTLQSTIRFKNPMTNQYDLRGETNLAQALHDYSDAKKNIKSQGGTVHDLVDPNSKFYFARPENMARYQTSMQEQLSGGAQDRTNKALGTQREDHNADEKPVNKNVRQPNEDPVAYLKRRGFGG